MANDPQSSAELGVTGSTLGNALQQVLTAQDIQPGDQPGYETCKGIYLYHPFGAKIAEKPVKMAQSQPRNISIPNSPEDRVKEEFLKTWDKIGADKRIYMTRVLAKVYGISAIALMEEKVEVEKPLDFKTLYKRKFTFNIYDPLNVAGSLVLNQDPMAFDFQHAQEIRVSGNTFHRSRSRVVMNEFPIYISYTPSTYGFTGRSCYQRALFPLKSFVQTMQTNDMISLKAAVIVEKIKQPSSVINQAMRLANAFRRTIVKAARIGNVVSIGPEDSIESIDLKNLSEPFMTARKNIVQDIASGVPMPARLLTEESYAEGFGEGSEDAKDMARFVKEEREQMQPLYDFFDEIVMHTAWTPDFYEIIQKEYPRQYGGVEFDAAFYQWKNSFKAEWPNLLEEPDSEKVKVDDIKLRALISILMALMPKLPPEELAKVIEWVCDNMNEMRLLFSSPLNLDFEAIAEMQPEPGFGEEEGEGEEGDDKSKGKPMKALSYTAADAVRANEAIEQLSAAVKRLPERRKFKPVMVR
jgi:hypothetical protein